VTFDNELLESFTAEWTESCPSSDSRAGALDSCFDALTGRARQVLRLRYFESFTAEEIARRTASSGAAVRVMLQRIRDRLRACVEHQLSAGGGEADMSTHEQWIAAYLDGTLSESEQAALSARHPGTCAFSSSTTTSSSRFHKQSGRRRNARLRHSFRKPLPKSLRP
jgi:hypothetical protein